MAGLKSLFQLKYLYDSIIKIYFFQKADSYSVGQLKNVNTYVIMLFIKDAK